jgi:Nif-specific regulatory protein
MVVPGIVGRSEAMAEVLHEIAVVAPKDITVLLTGPTGTGKTHIAGIIHECSRRRGGPFVEVNCTALPDNLFESEFFGALPGAYTGATRRVEGKVAQAEGGTLFLDEVGELSPGGQSKLLQFLHSKQFCPLGGASPRKANVRVIAATNVDLRRAMRERRFRDDLFFRLSGMTLRIPSLSERYGDVRLLVHHFCERACREHDLGNIRLSPEALRAFETAEWPGNVRELEKAVEMAAIRASHAGSCLVEAEDVIRDVWHEEHAPAALSFREETKRFQRDLLVRTLTAEDWKVASAARSLQLTRAHVYALMDTFGIRNEA